MANRFVASNTVKITVQDAAPGIFSVDNSATGQGIILVNGTSNIAALPDPNFAGEMAGPGDTVTLLMTVLPAGLPPTLAA